MKISIGFSTNKTNIFSKIIRWATGSKVRHVWLLADIFGVPCVVEASEKGFFPSMSLERFRRKNEIVLLVPIEHDLSEGLAWAATHFGDRYDFEGLFGMIKVLIGRVLHKAWKNPWNNRRALFCAEVIAEIFRRSRFPGAGALHPAETGPEDLRRFLTS